MDQRAPVSGDLTREQMLEVSGQERSKIARYNEKRLEAKLARQVEEEAGVAAAAAMRVAGGRGAGTSGASGSRGRAAGGRGSGMTKGGCHGAGG